MKIFNPATEELIREITEDNKHSVEKKFDELQAAQASWKKVALKERIAILQRFSELLEENLEQNAFILTQEVGKPLQQSRNEIKGGIGRIQWLTGNAERYLSDEIMKSEEGLEEKISYEPLGVVCNIS